MERDEQIRREAAALWRELFAEPPPTTADGAMLLDIITRSLTEVRYDRLRTPHLRPTNISLPRTFDS